MNLPGPSIPFGSAIVCMDCRVVWDMASPACPKCASEISGFPVSNGLAAKLITTQRNLIDEAEGVLLTVSKRQHGHSSALCARMIERIRQGRESTKPALAERVTADA